MGIKGIGKIVLKVVKMSKISEIVNIFKKNLKIFKMLKKN